jgi:hypothetical protein
MLVIKHDHSQLQKTIRVLGPISYKTLAIISFYSSGIQESLLRGMLTAIRQQLSFLSVHENQWVINQH